LPIRISARSILQGVEGEQMRAIVALSSGVVLALALWTPALPQETEPTDSAAIPDHAILTNAKIGGSPDKEKPKLAPSTSSLLRRAEVPSVDEVRAAIWADVARDPKLGEFYRDLLNPDQSFKIGEDGQGNRTIIYLTPDRRPVVIRPDE
jgi:hypothetical protein